MIKHFTNETQITINKSTNTTIIKLPTIREDNTIDMYLKLYPIEKKGRKILLYKSVHKVGDEYLADYDRSEYKIGLKRKQEIQKDENNTCGPGLHVSEKGRAREFGRGRSDQAILEFEVNPKDVFVGKDCDGKVRVDNLTPIREIPKEEWYI